MDSSAGGNVLALKARLQAKKLCTPTRYLTRVKSGTAHSCARKELNMLPKGSLTENIQHLLHKATILEEERRVDWKEQKQLQRRKYLADRLNRQTRSEKTPDDDSKENDQLLEVNAKMPDDDRNEAMRNNSIDALLVAKQRVYQKKVRDITMLIGIECDRLSKVESEICRYENSLQSLALSLFPATPVLASADNSVVLRNPLLNFQNVPTDSNATEPREEELTESLSPIQRGTELPLLVPPAGLPEQTCPSSDISSFIYIDDEPSRTSSSVLRSKRTPAPIKLKETGYYSQGKNKGYSHYNSTKLRA